MSLPLSVRIPPRVRGIARRTIIHRRASRLLPVDAVLCAYPKSGSTWLRFLLADALSNEEPDFDNIRVLSPPLGKEGRGRRILPGGGRLVKSHDSPAILGECQMLYLVRNPRDVVVSEWHHAKKFWGTQPPLPEFIRSFVAGKVGAYGGWVGHVENALLRVASDDRLILVRYEDLLADPRRELQRACSYLGTPIGKEIAHRAVAANGRDAMRLKEASSSILKDRSLTQASFVRCGTSGAWVNEIDREAFAPLERAVQHLPSDLGYG